MKRGVSIFLIIISIILVGLYTIGSTYSVIIDVIEQDGIKEIVNEITIRDILINEDGSYNDTYYIVKKELELKEEESNILMNSKPLNSALKTVLESIVEYKVNNNIDAKLTNDEIYNLIVESILNTDNIDDELKSRVINKSSKYREDISDYIYNIEVSLLGDS